MLYGCIDMNTYINLLKYTLLDIFQLEIYLEYLRSSVPAEDLTIIVLVEIVLIFLSFFFLDANFEASYRTHF